MSKAQANLIRAEQDLRIHAMSMNREIKRMEVERKKQSTALVKQMKEGGDKSIIVSQAELIANIEGNIRSMTNDRQKLLMFAGKVKIASSKLKTGATMVAVSQALSRATKNIQLEKIEAAMGDLDKQYDDIDVMTSVLNSATAQTTASTASPEAIEGILRKTADAAGLELSEDLNSAGMVETAPVKAGPSAEDEEASAQRLKSLRQAA